MIKKDNLEEERNILARIRTSMSNERTLMSYYRTAFAIVGLSVFIMKFYESEISKVLSVIFLCIGIGLAIYGYSRYRKYHRRIIGKKKQVNA